MSTGERIKFLREKNGQTQKEFADFLGLDVQTISCYERGKLIPRPRKINLIAVKCGVKVSWLLSGLGPMSTVNDDKCETDLQEIVEFLREHPEQKKLVLDVVRMQKKAVAHMDNTARPARRLKPKNT